MNNFEWYHHFADPVAERLSPDFSHLLILIGQHSLQYSILNPETSMFISLASFRVKIAPKSPALYAAQLRQLFNDDELFRRKYQAVTIGMESPVHTLVPSAMFDREHLSGYLRFNFRLPENHPLFSDHLPEIDAYNIYSPAVSTLEAVREFFPGAAIVHAGTSLVRACYQYYRLNQSPLVLFLHVREKDIDLCCIGENGLMFFNTFASHCKEDILYFTLYAMDQLRLRVEDTTVSVSGFLEKDTETYVLLSQYILELSFTSRPGPAVYSPVFHSLPGHFYQQLFGLALCGS
ncbi:MAG: DUF3822 family protein [Bacteroidales bacterium]|nr:DUF3822 family protein [Bacteroidales bacterium]